MELEDGLTRHLHYTLILRSLYTERTKTLMKIALMRKAVELLEVNCRTWGGGEFLSLDYSYD